MPFSKNIKFRLQQDKPLILLGMHRSGTSLTSRLLEDVGIHMGHQLSKNAEAIYFQKLNRRIFSDADARWSNIEPILLAMDSKEFVTSQVNAMQYTLFNNGGVKEFFGPDHWQDICKDQPSIVWGWKDPRNTITFPIWLHIFPTAKFVHVIRNGIDVAISLHRRAQRYQRQWWRKFSPFHDYDPDILNFDHCFHLWEEYISFCLEHRNLIPREHYLQIRYEDLLAEPYTQFHRLLDFLECSVKEDVIRTTCEQINRGRLNNSRYAVNYQNEILSLPSSPWLQRLGY